MTVNDARLFAVEARLTEEEEMRVKEYEYIRDLMKKLIYALEQLNMVNIENKKLLPGKDSLDENSANLLPSLINAGKDQKATDFAKTMEFMMLKRLNYLRN